MEKLPLIIWGVAFCNPFLIHSFKFGSLNLHWMKPFAKIQYELINIKKQ